MDRRVKHGPLSLLDQGVGRWVCRALRCRPSLYCDHAGQTLVALLDLSERGCLVGKWDRS